MISQDAVLGFAGLCRMRIPRTESWVIFSRPWRDWFLLGTYTQHSRAGLLSAVPSGLTSGPAVLTKTL
jgi:hypothetical protein